MRTSMLVVAAVLGLAAAQGAARLDAGRLVRTAYEDTVQRYQGGQAVQRSEAPQRTQPLADRGGAAAHV